MNKCWNCIWHYVCICEICEDENNTVACVLKNTHISGNDCCDRFARIEEIKGGVLR